MRIYFDWTTWTCDNCGYPNFNKDMYCKRCGARKPDRYGKMMARCRIMK